jgi:hypothetical protein
MKLLTDELKTKLLANGANRDQDHAPVVKFFNPVGSATWLISEMDPILKLRREQLKAARQKQPALFELQDDARPKSQRTASGRLEEPMLFPE